MNKDVITGVLKVTQGIQSKDNKLITEGVNIINTISVTMEDINYVKDYIKNTNYDLNIMTPIVNELTLIDNKDALLLSVELRNTTNNITKNRITEILNTDYKFDDDAERYSTFALISKIIIRFNDPSLIELLLTKLQ